MSSLRTLRHFSRGSRESHYALAVAVALALRREAMSKQMLYTVRWLIVTMILAMSSIAIFAHYDWASNSAVMPIAGGSVILKRLPVKYIVAAIWAYSTTEAVTFLTLDLETSRSVNAIAFVTDAIPSTCVISGGQFTHNPRASYVGEDRILAEPFDLRTRKVYEIPLKTDASHLTFMTCNITAFPGRETFASRTIAFSPVGINTNITKTLPLGYFRLFPEFVSFTVAGNSEIYVNGVAGTGPLAVLQQDYEVSPMHPVVRARWNDIQSDSRKQYGTFFAAALLGLATGTLLEFLRPYLNGQRGGRKR